MTKRRFHLDRDSEVSALLFASRFKLIECANEDILRDKHAVDKCRAYRSFRDGQHISERVMLFADNTGFRKISWLRR